MKKKVLVINDPSVGQWNDSQRIVAAERFKALQQEGFKIYVQKEGDFAELDTTSLKDPKSILDSRLITDKKITELAVKKLELSQDELLVLNHQELAELMQGTNDDWAELASLEKVDLHETNISIASLNELIKTSGDKIKVLNLSRCVNLKQGTIPEDIALDALEKLIIGDESKFGDAYPIPALGGIKLKRLNNLNQPSIKHILKAASNLKVLKLGRCDGLRAETLDDLKSTSLETLDLSDTHADSISIGRIISNNPKLKTIKLANGCTLREADLSNDLNLIVLETLDLYHSDIDANALGKLLAKATGLKELRFSAPDHFEFDQLKYLNLNSLETCDLHIIKNINSSSLSNFLLKSSKLKRLNLSVCQILGGELDKDLNLTSLETLNLSYSIIDCNLLSVLLEKASGLKTLQLDSLKVKGEIPNDPNLNSLEMLDLSASNINSISLSKFLANVPKLKELKLENCNNISDNLPDGLNLASLETLDLAGSNISNKSLSKLLAQATNLNTLDLTQCIVSGDDLPNDLDLSSLQTLKLEGGNISPALIAKIQSKAPQLNIISSEAQQRSQQSLLTTSSQTADVKKHLDADTEFDPKKQFNLTRIFYAGGNRRHPEPSKYRLFTFDEIQLNPELCQASQAFTLKNKSRDLNIEVQTIPQSSADLKGKLTALPDDNRYYGIQTINLSDQWQSLASLSAEEVMTDYHMSHSIDVEIGYSKRDNLYYVRRKPGSSQDNPITIDFILNIPQSSKELLPVDIQQKIKECQNFQAKSLEISQSNPTGADYLRALKAQKVGACRHRSLVFKSWMEEQYPQLQTRIVNNDCHSFVEVYYNNHWVVCDLGGYPAELVIKEPNQPKPQLVKLTSEGTIEHPVRKKSYFATESVQESKTTSTPLFMQHLLSSAGHKKLIHVPSQQNLNGFRHHLQQYCKSTSRPCFYIHSPEDLMCSAPYIKRDGITGIIKNGPGGPLHEFLMAHSKDGSKPVLIVNYDNFSPSEIVRFNSLLDKERFADGSPLPIDAEVIGLMNPENPGTYDGADLRSRFDKILTSPLSADQLVIPPITEQKTSLSEHSQSINLYGGTDWEDRLLGHWVMEGKSLHFVEGELLLAPKANKTHIELKNAPWGNDAFECFWQEALLHRSFQSHGVSYDLPKDFKLSKIEGYSFKETSKHIKINEGDIPADALVLNRGLFSRFFGQYLCDNQNKTIHYEEGLFAKNQGKPLNLYLSDTLDLDSWALFLDTCQKHQVHLNLTLAPGVTLPKELGISAEIRRAPTAIPWTSTQCPVTAYVQSTDMDVTLSLLQEQALIIDVSEVSAVDLLMKLDGAFDEKTLSFHFSEHEGALLKALKDNRTVVLKGRIGEDLRDVLSEFLLKRQHETSPNGHLLVMSDQAQLFPMVPSFTHAVTLADKKALLIHDFPNELLEQRSFAKLQAMSRYLALHPHEAGEKAWQGLSTLPLSPMPEAFDLRYAKDAAFSFNQQRLKSVEDVLRQSSFVFLAGMTGVGKTTFIHEVWKKQHGAVHLGEASLLAWAKDSSPGIKTLFIDEANISSRQWSEFEGLFQKPPRILIGNELIELSKDHKVIFAGNPLSYGGDRQMPSLFARHGNSVIFNPMPPVYLYQELLMPIFAKASFKSMELARPILEVAQYLGTLDREKVLITPRELSMMALLTVTYCKKHPKVNLTEVAQYYAYTLTEGFVPDEHKAAFRAKFKTVDKLARPQLKMPDNFLISPNNQPALDALSDILDLRALRQSKGIQAEGGLGGLILEGEPGLGKTELVVKTLVAYGLRKGDINKDNSEEQVFYVMPVSMSFVEKEKLLLKAFHEGAVVVIDEINSAPIMERLLNDLLMGKDPKGQAAKKPGFMVIGTQNPVTMAGRTRSSTAVDHRMHKVIITEYPKEQMVKILVHKGLPEDISQDMVAEYLILRQNALKDSSPNLCFRDLLNRAEQEITALSKLNTAQTCVFRINQELGRLSAWKTENNRFAVRIGLIKASDKKIEALNALKEIINSHESNDEAFHASLSDWKNKYYLSITEQRNVVHGFFSPKHKSISAQMIDELFESLDIPGTVRAARVSKRNTSNPGSAP